MPELLFAYNLYTTNSAKQAQPEQFILKYCGYLQICIVITGNTYHIKPILHGNSFLVASS